MKYLKIIITMLMISTIYIEAKEKFIPERKVKKTVIIKEITPETFNYIAKTWVRDTALIRIKSLKEFNQFCRGKAPFDFERYDLVVFQATLHCASGEIVYKTHGENIIFNIKTHERCTHQTEQLHINTYKSYFMVTKDAKINNQRFYIYSSLIC